MRARFGGISTSCDQCVVVKESCLFERTVTEIMTETVNADLLFCDADLIVQQTNTVTRRAHGLSDAIAKRFKYANVYERRSGKTANTADKRDVAGSVVLCRPTSGESGPIVACLMAQMAPGKPGDWCLQYKIDAQDDTAEKREEYFRDALLALAETIRKSEGEIKSVAFPFGIGCGLAGGKWSHYEAMIEFFARSLPGIKVTICKK